MIVKKTCHNSIQINQWLCSTVLKIPFNEQIKVPNQTSLQAFGSGCKRQPATTPTTQVGKKKKNGNSSDSHDPRSGKRKKNGNCSDRKTTRGGKPGVRHDSDGSGARSPRWRLDAGDQMPIWNPGTKQCWQIYIKVLTSRLNELGKFLCIYETIGHWKCYLVHPIYWKVVCLIHHITEKSKHRTRQSLNSVVTKKSRHRTPYLLKSGLLDTPYFLKER